MALDKQEIKTALQINDFNRKHIYAGGEVFGMDQK